LHIRFTGRLLLLVVVLALLVFPIPGYPVSAAEPVIVKVGLPSGVKAGNNFDVYIKINAVTNLASWGFDLLYDNSVIQINGLQGYSSGLSSGFLGTTEMPNAWSSIRYVNGNVVAGTQGQPVTWNMIRVGGSLNPRFSATWTGAAPSYLAVVHFRVLEGVADGTASEIYFLNCFMGDDKAAPITPVTWQGGVVNVDNTPPESPVGLAVASAINGRVRLTWTANTDAIANYLLYYSADEGMNWDTVLIDPGRTAYTVTALSNGTAYIFGLAALDVAGNESAILDTVEATPVINNSAPYSITLTPAGQTLVAGKASAKITCQTLNRLGSAANVSTPTVINLTSTSTAGRFDISDKGLFNGTVTSVTIAAGKNSASFYYRDTRAGSTVIKLSNDDLTSAQQPETITADVMNQLRWGSPPPSSALAGAAWPNFTLKITDQYGNLTAATGNIKIVATGGSISGIVNKTATAGTATFSGICGSSLGTLNLSATCGTLTAAPASAVYVYPVLEVSGYPATAVAGEANNFNVAAVDNYGNRVQGYTGTIHFTSSASSANLPTDFTFISADNSTHAFSAALNTSGSQYIKATDITDSLIFGAQTGITVLPQIDLARSLPGEVCYGQSFNVTVNFQVTTDNCRALTLTDWAPAGWQVAVENSWNSPSSTSSSASANRARISWNGPFASGTLLSAVYRVTVPYGLTEGSYNFGQGSLEYYLGTSGPHSASVIANSSLNVFQGATLQGTVYNASGQKLNSAVVTLDGKSAQTVDSNGVYQFESLPAGSHSLAAGCAGYRSQTQNQVVTDLTAVYTLDFTGDYSLVSTAPVRLIFTSSAPTPAAGVPTSITCQALNVLNEAAELLVPVVIDLSSSSSSGRFDASASGLFDGSFTSLTIPAGQNTAAFFYKDTRAGTATLTLSSTALSGAQQSLTIVAAANSQLLWKSQPPLKSLAGAVWPAFTVKITDQFGNLTSGADNITISAVGGLLNGTLNKAAAAGLATFNDISSTSPGTLTLSASSGALTATPPVSIYIYPALQVSGYPSPAIAGAANSLTVKAVDKAGNPAGNPGPGYSGTIHFSSSDPAAVLPPDYTFVTADNSTRTFGAVLNTTGSQSITATDVADGQIVGTQSAIKVYPSSAVWRSSPSEVYRGKSYSVEVVFTAPANDFKNIVLRDLAPAGWTLGVGDSWNSPPSNTHNLSGNRVEYAWNSSFDNGTTFTAIYDFTVPENASPGVYTLGGGTLEYYIGSEGPFSLAVQGDFQVVVLEGSRLLGSTYERNGNILEGVTLSLDGTTPVISGPGGSFRLLVTTTGPHTISAFKAGYRLQTRTFNLTDLTIDYRLDFKADFGLIPAAPDLSYVLACTNKWKYPPSDGTGLSLSRVLSVVNAWMYPLTEAALDSFIAANPGESAGSAESGLDSAAAQTQTYNVSVTRTLPAAVYPGLSFDVTLTFSAPGNELNAIGLSDLAPSGWTVETDDSWNSPPSNAHNVTANRADFMWYGPFDNGTVLRAVYQLTVPSGMASGTYFFNPSDLVPGLEYYIGGEGPYYANIEGQDQVNVKQASTAALTSSHNPALFSQPVTFTATVQAAPTVSAIPGGTISFQDGSVVLATVELDESGQAVFTTSTLAVGNHSINARYSSDSDFIESQSPFLTQTVNQSLSLTTLESAANPAGWGQNVILTATVSAVSPATAVPAGTLRFLDAETELANVTLDAAGQATLATTALTVGSHSISAVFDGTANFAVSTSSFLTQIVNPGASHSLVVASTNPSVYGQSVTYGATVSALSPAPGTPTGAVQLLDGIVVLGTRELDGAGQATFDLDNLTAGMHSISLIYSGDERFSPSSAASFNQVVDKAATTLTLVSSLNPANYEDNVTLTATLQVSSPGGGQPTGAVQFLDAAAEMGSMGLNGSGQAAYSTAALSGGSHTISALYPGDHNFASSTSAVLNQIVDQTLAVSTPSLPPGDIQTAYSKSLAARGGTPPYTWSKTGSLPPGLTLAGNTISGTPSGSLTSAKEFSFTIQVKDQAGATATQKLSITINPALAISTTALSAAYTGVSYSQTLTAKGGSGNYNWTLQSGTLPAGLTLDSHGALKGLPEEAGTFNPFFSVDDGIGLATIAKALTLYVYDPLVVGNPTLPDAEIKAAYSAALTASGGCAPYSWAKDGVWPSGLSISKSGVISGKPTVRITAPTTFTFSVKVTDSASKVKTAVSNLLATDAASDQEETGADNAANDQTDLLGVVKIPNNSTLKTFTITIYPELTMTLAATDKALTALLPADNQSAYACPLVAAGGLAPYVWSKGPNFPEWLTLDPSSGLLSGTPTVDGSFKVNLLVTDSLGYSLTKTAALKVYKSLAITTPSLPSDDIGVKYKSTTLKATGGKTPYTWSIVAGELPSGLSLTSKGLISGTPDNETSGAYPLTIQVSDGITAVTRELAITINPPLAIGALPPGTLGTAYSLDLTTLTGGGSGGYKFAKAGTWPSWLKLDTKSGIISGTPPTAETYTFDIKVTDSLKGTLTQTLTLTIN
jgi:hypothetical protein